MHVVALSGGKDSTAMALRLAEVEPRDYTYVCTPTGNELPVMFEQWKRLGVLLGKPIVPIMGGTLLGLIHRWNALPNWRQRWCTRMLKIEPFAAWLMQQPKPLTFYVGLRADEDDDQRSGGDYRNIPGAEMRFPLREWGWGLSEVVSYLGQRNVDIPERTDCAWCFFQTLGEWWRLWKDHLDIYMEAEALEESTGHTWRSPGRDTWPTSLRELRKRFEAGHVPKGNPAQRDLFKGMKCRVCTI